jgi:SAM-dependent methyltransferase
MTLLFIALNSFLVILLVFIIIASIIFWLLFFWSAIITRTPFVPVPKKLLREIIKALKIKESSVVYDLGCGDGRVLAACYKMHPQAQYVGIERDFIAIFVVWLRRKIFSKADAISIFQGDFFKYDLSAATHIFIYLYPQIMDNLSSKLEKELLSGARVVSCDFSLPRKEPAEVIDLHRSRFYRGRKLFIYIY